MAIRMVAPLEIGISCCDLLKMRRFYEETLGFSFIGEAAVGRDTAKALGLCSEGYTVARLQTPYGERLKLLAANTPPAKLSSDSLFLEKPGAMYLTFIIDHIDEAIQRLAKAGVPFITGASSVQVRPGVQAAFCRDPEGNALELVEFAAIAAYRPDLK